MTTETGKLEIDIPRDRQASFDPQLIAKYQRRFPDFDEKIVSMYARGMSTREITGHLHDLYGIDVSPDLISTVTDAVLDEVATWQQRPLDPVYPLISIRVKIRDEGMVRNKAIHIALGVRADGGLAVDIGFLYHSHQGFLGRPARLQEAGSTSLAQLRDLRDPARTGVPIDIRSAAPPQRLARPLRRARPRFDLQFHDPLGRKGQDVAHEVAIGLLLNQLDQRHS
uniref:Mutator family transposase n=1 Tax=Rhizobium loti TaxID=381 RepID=M5ALU5_RHILI|nr:probable transposase [Mesorhizobium loti NZP2037]